MPRYIGKVCLRHPELGGERRNGAAASGTVSGFSAIANYLSGIAKIETDGF